MCWRSVWAHFLCFSGLSLKGLLCLSHSNHSRPCPSRLYLAKSNHRVVQQHQATDFMDSFNKVSDIKRTLCIPLYSIVLGTAHKCQGLNSGQQVLFFYFFLRQPNFQSIYLRHGLQGAGLPLPGRGQATSLENQLNSRFLFPQKEWEMSYNV